MKKLGFDLILLGDPASGKDTQAQILRKKYALVPVESGKHWRAMAKKKNAEGAWLRRTMSLGKPTPVPLMLKFLKEKVAHVPVGKNLIFVGNPRLAPEAKLLKKLLAEKQRDFLVLFIRVPKQEILRRVLGRMSKQDRADDSKMEFVLNRIKWQNSATSKGVKYFESIHKLKYINGNQSIIKVAADIQKTTNDYQRS